MDQAGRRTWKSIRPTAALAQDWLDVATVRALRSSFDRAEPPPAVWSRIQESVLRSRQRAARGSHVALQVLCNKVGRSEVFNWYDVLVHQERCKDMVREAGQYRFMRQALAGLTRRERFHCRALRWLGRRLVAWGVRLQERYGAVAAARNFEWCAVPLGSRRR